MAEPIKAVFFDVDFTLIYPGPKFQAEGYCECASRHGMAIDGARFDKAVLSASSILDAAQDNVYNDQIFIDYTAHIIRSMGGDGSRVEACAAEIYREWAASKHFIMYDDVPPALKALRETGMTIGLISNSHRSLESFQSHFELEGLIDVAISSSQHGYMKPHPSIFTAALTLAGARAEESVMVGDSLSQDIEGARRIGMRGILVRRSESISPPAAESGVPVIKTLTELSQLL